MQRASVICELTFPSAVLAVRLNRKRLAVVLEEEIYLYDISNMSLLYTIPTSPNPGAICALSPSSENCYIAYPLPKPREDTGDKRPAHAPPLSTYVPPTAGEVLIFDTLTLKAVNVIEAHRSPLSCIAINGEGTLLATASETGTIVRVFSVPRGQKLFQFRRGTYPSTIYSMSFNLPSTMLCVSSSSDTVHIFRLAAPGPPSTSATSALNPTSSSPLSKNSAAATGFDASTPPPRAAGGDHRSSRSRSYDSGGESPSGSPRSEAAEPADGTGRTTGNIRESGGGGPLSNAHRRQSGSFSSMLRRSSQLMGRSVAGVVGSYLPQTVTEMWEPLRDFAYIKIPKPGSAAAARRASSTQAGTSAGAGKSATPPPHGTGGGPPVPSGGSSGPLRSVVTMSGSGPQVMVVTSDGGFYVFHIDLEQGGEGHLVRHYS